MIDIKEHDLKAIQDILGTYLTEGEVRVFGSRIKGTAQPCSDIDLVVVGQQKLPQKIMSELKYAFEESDLPFRVDLMDWHTLSVTFKDMIDKDYEVIYPFRGE